MNAADSPASRFRKNRGEESMLSSENLANGKFDITQYKREVI